jgi:3-oxoacyl-[acyl-carrier protein] reductase
MVETEGLIASGLMKGPLYEESVKATPLGRIAKPEDIAKVAVFLASDDSGWVTGECILVAGGRR